ncbi:MAG: imidazole glycerol phosphate synthase subunit HisH [Rhodospirillaceae bacterium]|nr:imidazole glycerol phosphate synthase subunit HisH [Rhodospirillaceae bacterium]
MTTAIIDYGSGNLRSAAKAFERAAADATPTESVLVTDDPERVRKAERIVLPGVGAFADCKAGLAAREGMIEALEDAVLRRGVPFLGICVGMQLMARVGHEHGEHEGLGWIDGEVAPLEPDDEALKVPHMGWNDLALEGEAHPVLEGLPSDAHAYFVHSYGLTCRRPDEVFATVDYGGSVTAVAGRDNMVGTQFHPEKSQEVGLTVIGNFLRWQP